MTAGTSDPTDSLYCTSTGIPIQNVWYMLLYVWDAFQKKDRWKVASEQSPTLDGLLCSVLADLLQQRLRIGLGRTYRQEESEIAGIRGRVDFAKSVKRLAFQRGRSHCRFQSFVPNILKNQIIRSVLSRMIQIGNFGTDKAKVDALRSRLRRLVHRMGGIDLIELRLEEIQRQQRVRDDADYTMMLSICALIQQRQMPKQDAGGTYLPGLDRDTMTMFDIYERFVAAFYRAHLSGTWHVRSQRAIAWEAETSSQYLPSMYIDLELQHRQTGQLIVLDTKFTQHALLKGRWGNLTFDREHLFQIYAYLRSQEHHSTCHLSATGILLYPAASFRLSEGVKIQGHRVRWETIDLAQPWETIEHDLLQIPIRELKPL